MIRYPVPPPNLDSLVDAKVPGWRKRAKKRTDGFKTNKGFKEKTSIWSEVKPLFMDVQGENKCIYCERKFGSLKTSTVEHDLEHFRPKSHVEEWNVPASLSQLGVVITKPAAGNKGYYLLPYHLENYSSSCKTCNTFYKLDRFPVGAAYDMPGGEPRTLTTERPMLIYPVGDWDTDPETVISFLGFVPQANRISPDYHRGLVTIAFFGLDDIDMRSDLFLERAKIIVAMKPLLIDANDATKTAVERAQAQERVDRYTSAKAPHANCARSFERLFRNDRATADVVYKHADDYWASKS